jgi:hypothetical protein
MLLSKKCRGWFDSNSEPGKGREGKGGKERDPPEQSLEYF